MKDESTTGFLMTLVPDKAYFESTHFDALRSNYRQWQKGYSGYVFYHTLDGKFNNAWKFENGKVTKKVTQTSNDGIDVSMDAKKKITAEENCLYTYIDIWSQVCINYYSNSEYLDKICGDWYYDYTIVITECYDTDNTGGTSEDKNSTDSSGGGGVSTDCDGVVGGTAYRDSCKECVGGTTGKTSQCVPITRSRLKLNSFDPDEIAFLSRMYTKLNEDCVDKAINDTMNAGNMTYGGIQMNANIGGVAAVTTSGDLQLKFGINTDFSTFRHEWVHFYQREIDNLTSYGNKKGMMEFENAVFKDVEIYKKGSKQNLELQDMDEGSYSWIWKMEKVEGFMETKKNYIDWIKKLSAGGVDLTSSTEIAIAQQWAILFGEYSEYKTNSVYQYEGVDYPLTALSKLIQISNNCNK